MFKIIVIANLFNLIHGEDEKGLGRCGFDKLPKNQILDKFTYGNIEELPWHGSLEYSVHRKHYKSAVVLVTVQMVITSALELSQMPKKNFRALARVFVGQKCSKPGIPIREYIYHPEFQNTTMTSMALIQLDLDQVKQDLIPICPPPKYFANPTFYATRMYSKSDCNNVTINIYKMDFVSTEDCHAFYRKFGLELASMWPRYPACGKSLFGGECVWLSGTALAIRQYGRWRLVGLGLYGPGCVAPSKYLDYIKYKRWVEDNVRKPGRTTLTRVGDNHVILRRSLSHLQRFGECDEEETQYEIFSEKTTIDTVVSIGNATYNVTLLDTVDYSCVVVRAYHYKHKYTPKIKIRRWCASSSRFCFDQHHVEIKFYVLIQFQGATTYEVNAYGRQVKTMDPMKAMKYINQSAKRPDLPKYVEFKEMFAVDKTGYQWVPGWIGGSYKGFKIRRYEVYEHCISNATSIFDKRFCGQYEFTVEPNRWFKYKSSYYHGVPVGIDNLHFVWRYLSQRKKLQYPVDGYELIIDPVKQDYRNRYYEDSFRNSKPQIKKLYDTPNYIYYIYGFKYNDPYYDNDGQFIGR